jgi:hypothetical protein
MRIDPDTLAARVPSLVLQRRAGNAVRHGIATYIGSGSVEVAAVREGEGWSPRPRHRRRPPPGLQLQQRAPQHLHRSAPLPRGEPGGGRRRVAARDSFRARSGVRLSQQTAAVVDDRAGPRGLQCSPRTPGDGRRESGSGRGGGCSPDIRSSASRRRCRAMGSSLARAEAPLPWSFVTARSVRVEASPCTPSTTPLVPYEDARFRETPTRAKELLSRRRGAAGEQLRARRWRRVSAPSSDRRA